MVCVLAFVAAFGAADYLPPVLEDTVTRQRDSDRVRKYLARFRIS